MASISQRIWIRALPAKVRESQSTSFSWIHSRMYLDSFMLAIDWKYCMAIDPLACMFISWSVHLWGMNNLRAFYVTASRTQLCPSSIEYYYYIKRLHWICICHMEPVASILIMSNFHRLNNVFMLENIQLNRITTQTNL